MEPRERREPYDVRIIEDLWANFRHIVEAVAILAAGGKPSMHVIIEPGAAATVTRLFAVPHRAYDLFHAQVFVVPVKTTLGAPVPVAIVAEPVGGFSLNPKPPIFEDDNTADFVLPH